MPIAVAALLCSTGCADSPQTTSSPNILFLMTDDQRWDCLGSKGHPVLKTPHLDRLANQGVSFRNAFVTTSMCAVARASFYTGRYARNNSVRGPRRINSQLAPEILAASFPAVLKKAGYRTGCFGKWGIGGRLPKEVFDAWNAWTGQREYFHTVHGRKIHNSEFLTRHAEKFLRGVGRKQPFCLIVLYKAPHSPSQPDPRDVTLFAGATVPVPATYTDAHFERLPALVRNSTLSSGGRPLWPPASEKYQWRVKQYLRCIAGVDRSVGRILKVLDELNLEENTIVVFTSDNGYLLGERGLWGKWLMYEESIRIPLIIRDPRMPAAVRGMRPDQLVLNIDLSPTLLDLAGIEIPPGINGRSLAPLLRGKAIPWRDDFFYEHHFRGGKLPDVEGIRTTEWKYVVYRDTNLAEEELYDLVHDPAEERNVADNPAHAERLKTMRARYREYVDTLLPPLVP